MRLNNKDKRSYLEQYSQLLLFYYDNLMPAMKLRKVDDAQVQTGRERQANDLAVRQNNFQQEATPPLLPTIPAVHIGAQVPPYWPILLRLLAMVHHEGVYEAKPHLATLFSKRGFLIFAKGQPTSQRNVASKTLRYLRRAATYWGWCCFACWA